MKKSDFFSTSAQAQANEGLDPSSVLKEKNGNTEAVSQVDEINEDEDTVLRMELYEHAATWCYDTANFKFIFNPPAVETEIDGVLAAFRELYAAEPIHTIAVKRECFRRAYWEVYQPKYVSFEEVEILLMRRALELMTCTRFKKMLKEVGQDIDEDEQAWLLGWIIASHFVLLGSERVKKYCRCRKNNPFELDRDIDEPFFESKRLYELIDSSNPYYMESLLRYGEVNRFIEEEKKLNKSWLSSRLI